MTIDAATKCEMGNSKSETRNPNGKPMNQTPQPPVTDSSSEMPNARFRISGFGFRIFALLLLPLACTGCLKPLILFGYLLGGPPSIEPDFEIMTKKSMTTKEATVAVVCYAPLDVKYDFYAVDHELAKFVTFRLAQHKVKVVHPGEVQAWLDENADNWDEPSEIGKALGVKYVVYIDLESFNLWEAHSHDLLRGHAEGVVSVYEIDADGEGEKLYTKEISSQFPTVAPRAATEVPFATFKQQYLSRLSEEIGRLFYEYYNGDDIPDAT